MEAAAFRQMGKLAVRTEIREAIRLFQQSLSLSRAIGSPGNRTRGAHQLARTERERNNFNRSARLLRKSDRFNRIVPLPKILRQELRASFWPSGKTNTNST